MKPNVRHRRGRWSRRGLLSGPRARSHERLNDGDLPGGTGEVERRAAVGVRDGRVRAAIHQHGYHAGVSGGGRVVERRTIPLLGDVQIFLG